MPMMLIVHRGRIPLRRVKDEEEYAEAGEASVRVDGRLVPTRLPGETVPANG